MIPWTYPSLSHIIARAFEVFELVTLNLSCYIKDSRVNINAINIFFGNQREAYTGVYFMLSKEQYVWFLVKHFPSN